MVSIYQLQLVLLSGTGIIASAAGEYVLSKRTLASSNGGLDQTFFIQYFGTTDPSSTHGPCLDRWLQHAAPDDIGIHFPTSHETPSVPMVLGTNASQMTLADWDHYRVALHNASAKVNRKSGFHDFATVFYVPDLRPHLSAFKKDAVPFVSRQYKAAGTTMYLLMVVTPGNGHTLELQAPLCSGCQSDSDSCGFAPFQPTDCHAAHELPEAKSYYRDFWRLATSLQGYGPTLLNTSLPTPLLVMIRAPVTKIATATDYLETFLPLEKPVCSSPGGGCELASIAATTQPFAGVRRISNYTVSIRFVENPAAWQGDHPELDWAAWTRWTQLLHSEYTGEGWGFDRVLDYHFKLNDARSLNQETQLGVHLDHFASLHTTRGLRFSAFNTSQACPGGGFAMGSGYMMYSEGIEGTSGVELWGDVDRSYFGSAALYGWNGCSPMMGCAYSRPAAMCRTGYAPAANGHQLGGIRASMVSDWPTNLAKMSLICANGTKMGKIAFASYGNPEGDCAQGFKTGSCDVPGALEVVQRLCEGKHSCMVPTTPTVFGATANNSLCPEADWPVSLAVEAACE